MEIIQKPLKTIYNGIRFRSRLEARWAIFFDALRIIYEYEKTWFEFPDSLKYLPDFWLPQVKMWAEVKPKEFNEVELEKAFWLVKYTGKPLLKLIGMPENKPYFSIDQERSHFAISEPIDNYELYCLTNYHNYPTEEQRFYSNPGGENDSHWDDTELATEIAHSYHFVLDSKYL
jgi:hypothetical protein